MSETWSVKDVIERVDDDSEDVGLYLQWCDWFAMVRCDEALKVLRRLPPDSRISVNITGGTLFIGYKT
jgi:hypothetical protein